MISRIYVLYTMLTYTQKTLIDLTKFQGSISYSIYISSTTHTHNSIIHILFSLEHVNPSLPIRRSLGTGQRGVLTVHL